MLWVTSFNFKIFNHFVLGSDSFCAKKTHTSSEEGDDYRHLNYAILTQSNQTRKQVNANKKDRARRKNDLVQRRLIGKLEMRKRVRA